MIVGFTTELKRDLKAKFPGRKWRVKYSQHSDRNHYKWLILEVSYSGESDTAIHTYCKSLDCADDYHFTSGLIQ